MNTKLAEVNLASVLEHQKTATVIHSLYEYDYLIGIGVEFELYVFAIEGSTYHFDRSIGLPMNIPVGTRAAFPLEELADCCCVITPECFDEPEGYVFILHEMAHCYQSRTCESELRISLSLHQEALRTGNHMWELEYDFPYSNHRFCSLVGGISQWSAGEVSAQLLKIRSELSHQDYEYMVWQIWKEGFARFVENRIRRHNELTENRYGDAADDTGRQSHYHIGDYIWRHMYAADANAASNLFESYGIIERGMVI